MMLVPMNTLNEEIKVQLSSGENVLCSGQPRQGIPFVLVVLYLIGDRLYFEAKQRAHTFYAVTNERILIVTGIFNRKVKSLNLRTLSDISLAEGKNDEGTI